MRILSIFLVACLLLPLVPGKISAQEIAPAADYFVGDAIVESDYRLGPGDQVSANLIVLNNDITIDYVFTIGPDGKIYFPHIGEIVLLGLTIPEARKLVNLKIRRIYKEKYRFSFRLIEPRKVQVYLSGADDKPIYIGEGKFVYVYGEVDKSGRFVYLPGKKFSDYISYAGGPTEQASLHAATISRKDKKFRINGSDVVFNGDSVQDITILPGDVIYVPRNFFYFSDFASFANTILLALTLYGAVMK